MSRKRKLLVVALVVMLVVIPVFYITTNFIISYMNEDKDVAKPYTPSVITASMQYNISDYTVRNGSYVAGIGNMNVSDATNATFIEAKYAGPVSESNITIYTDDVTKWDVDGNLNSLINDTEQDYDGDGYSIRGSTTSNLGDARFIYENGTSKAMAMDISDMVKVNYTIRTDANDDDITFNIFRLYNSDTKYYTHTFDINLLRDTWTVFENNYDTLTAVGGMTPSDVINWIEWRFTPIRVNKDIWIDAGMFFSQAIGVDQRLLKVSLDFTGIADYEHYVCNISAHRTLDTVYDDDFFSENHTDWGSDAPITMSRDSTSVQEGTYRMIATFDATANATFWFDNQTSKNMQVDWSNYSRLGQTVWGNDTFTVDYGRFYTDTENYYHASIPGTYSTTPTEISVPFIVFVEIGSPTWSNISWIEWKINNIENPNPVELYFDHIYTSTGGQMLFDSPDDVTGEEQCIKHVHAYVNFTVTLNATTIQTNGYVNVTLNDGKLADDLTNTTIDIDLLCVYAWNETNAFPVINEGVVCHNPDDTDNVYGRYRTYIFTVNVSDADGFADIHYVNVSTDIGATTYNCTADTFTDDSPYWEINQTASSADRAGIYCNITCGTILYLVPGLSAINVEFDVIVVDDSDAIKSEITYSTYDFSSELKCGNLTISDDRGNLGQELYVTGNMYYADSLTYVRPPSAWVDMWAVGDISNKSDVTLGVDGDFNITGIESSLTAGLNNYTIRSVRNGTGFAGECLCHVCETKTYISDQILVTFSRSVLSPSSEEHVRMLPVMVYDYDGVVLTNFDMTVTRGGVAWKAFDEANVSTEFWDAASGESHTYDVGVVTDNTYDITDYSSTAMTVEWYAGHGGDDDGGDVDVDDWLGWLDMPEIEEDPFFWFVMFLIFIFIMMGCIGFGGCGRHVSDAVSYGKGVLEEGTILLTPLTKEKYRKKKPVLKK